MATNVTLNTNKLGYAIARFSHFVLGENKEIGHCNEGIYWRLNLDNTKNTLGKIWF